MIDLKDAKSVLGKLASERKLIIFVGSGISVDSKLPTWEGFLDNFIEFCKGLANQYKAYDIQSIFEKELFENAIEEKGKNPVHVATVLKSKMSSLPPNLRTNIENDFRRWFFSLFANASPNAKHDLIVRTDYPYILTSNYDLLLEDAQKGIGSPYSTFSFFQKEMIAESVYLRRPAIIHVHGQCSDIVLDKIVLTSEDYIQIIKKNVPGFSFVIQSLFLNYSTLFVGYGASDPHLEDLIEEFSYFFNFPQTDHISKNYLVVTRKRAGRILDDYKKRMRTELVVIDHFGEYDELLTHLQACAPRQLSF